MKNRHDKIFLEHIILAIDEIFRFAAGDREVAYNDDKTKRAVSKDFEIIGEAAGNVTDALKQKYPEVPWREVKDFRNVLVHDYWDIDYAMMWKIMEDELPKLRAQIEHILKNI